MRQQQQQRTQRRYKVLHKIGEGAFGEVLLAEDRAEKGRLVAVKALATSSSSSSRELNALRRASPHPHVVALLDAVPRPLGGLWLVFEHVPLDLARVLAARVRTPLPRAQAKFAALALLRALAHLHARRILHRDIKPSNILVSADGTSVKVADLGLARIEETSGQSLTNGVATRWYRAPELLLGATRYDGGIDVWAAGCVLAEMLRGGRPLFCGRGDIDQLARIVRALGDVSEARWKGVEKLPDFGKIAFPGAPANSVLPEVLGPDVSADESATQLLSRLVAYPPERMLASEALAHPWFFTAPLPAKALDLEGLES